MRIETNSLEKYILTCIAVSGEIEKSWLTDRLHPLAAKSYIKNTLSKLTCNKMIKLSREETFRLKKPGGIEWLKKDPDLYRHYMMITNGHYFYGSSGTRSRRKRLTHLLEIMFEDNTSIDFINVDYISRKGARKKSKEGENVEQILEVMKMLGISPEASSNQMTVFQGEEIIPYPKLLEYINPCQSYFFSSKISRQTDENRVRGTDRENLSRSLGVLIGGGNQYPVYWVEPTDKWNKTVEAETASRLQNIWWNTEGKGASKERDQQLHERGSAILYCKSKEDFETVAKEIKIHAVGKRSPRGIKPWLTYDSAYMIPDDKENHFIKHILTTYHWEDKLTRKLFDGMEINNNISADVILDGNPAWELITCDISKLYNIMNAENAFQDSNRQVVIVAHEWQKDILQSVLKNPILITLNKNESKNIFSDMIKEEGNNEGN